MLLIDVSNKCQLNCEYCYATHKVPELNLVNLLSTLLVFKESGKFCFHGNEPLCEFDLVVTVTKFLKHNFPKCDLSLQTNGLFLKDNIAEFLIEHDIEVGVSLDGPWPLNRLRCDKKTTEVIQKNIKNFFKLGGQRTGIISVMTYVNTPHKKEMLEWTKEMDESGASGHRFNPVLLNPHLAPDKNDLIEFYTMMADEGINFTPWIDLFKKQDEKCCSWRGCDPEASSIPIILPDGSISSCLKAAPIYHWSKPIGLRTSLLQQLSYEEGGCKGCKWWSICMGGCPHEGEDATFRSQYCEVWRALFAKAFGGSAINSVGCLHENRRKNTTAAGSCGSRG